MKTSKNLKRIISNLIKSLFGWFLLTAGGAAFGLFLAAIIFYTLLLADCLGKQPSTYLEPNGFAQLTAKETEEKAYVRQMKLTWLLASQGIPDAYTTNLVTKVTRPTPSKEWKEAYKTIHEKEWDPTAVYDPRKEWKDASSDAVVASPRDDGSSSSSKRLQPKQSKEIKNFHGTLEGVNFYTFRCPCDAGYIISEQPPYSKCFWCGSELTKDGHFTQSKECKENVESGAKWYED